MNIMISIIEFFNKLFLKHNNIDPINVIVDGVIIEEKIFVVKSKHHFLSTLREENYYFVGDDDINYYMGVGNIGMNVWKDAVENDIIKITYIESNPVKVELIKKGVHNDNH
jgi:hypothetical protein